MHFENSTKKKENRREEEKEVCGVSAPQTVDSSAARRATYFVQIKRNKFRVRKKTQKIILYDSIVVGIQKSIYFCIEIINGRNQGPRVPLTRATQPL